MTENRNAIYRLNSVNIFSQEAGIVCYRVKIIAYTRSMLVWSDILCCWSLICSAVYLHFAVV